MSLTLKSAAAIALIAALSAPAMAATAPAVGASLAAATQADAVPVSTLTGMVGTWSAADLSMFDKAKSIKVLDTRKLYQDADLQKIASAETGKTADIDKIRAAIKGDAGLNAWFTANKLDVNRVIAVSVPTSGMPEIVLY